MPTDELIAYTTSYRGVVFICSCYALEKGDPVNFEGDVRLDGTAVYAHDRRCPIAIARLLRAQDSADRLSVRSGD